MMESHVRFDWIAKLMEVEPDDRILEIGCGVGFGVEAITPLLKGGKIVAIDRSATAISKAMKRNQKGIAEGKASFLQTELLTFSDPDLRCEKIFSFNINLFWTNKSIAQEMSVIKSHLQKRGSLYISYGPMVATGFEKISKLVAENLEREKFRIVNTVMEDQLGCCCFVVRAM